MGETQNPLLLLLLVGVDVRREDDLNMRGVLNSRLDTHFRRRLLTTLVIHSKSVFRITSSTPSSS